MGQKRGRGRYSRKAKEPQNTGDRSENDGSETETVPELKKKKVEEKSPDAENGVRFEDGQKANPPKDKDNQPNDVELSEPGHSQNKSRYGKSRSRSRTPAFEEDKRKESSSENRTRKVRSRSRSKDNDYQRDSQDRAVVVSRSPSPKRGKSGGRGGKSQRPKCQKNRR